MKTMKNNDHPDPSRGPLCGVDRSAPASHDWLFKIDCSTTWSHPVPVIRFAAGTPTRQAGQRACAQMHFTSAPRTIPHFAVDDVFELIQSVFLIMKQPAG